MLGTIRTFEDHDRAPVQLFGLFKSVLAVKNSPERCDICGDVHVVGPESPLAQLDCPACGEFPVSVRNSEKIALCDPVMPVTDSFRG